MEPTPSKVIAARENRSVPKAASLATPVQQSESARGRGHAEVAEIDAGFDGVAGRE